MQKYPDEKVLLEIEYFTRRIFAKHITTKEASKVVSFLNEITKTFKIETLVSDNGREFLNKDVEEWCKRNNVNQTFSIPYYKQSYGKVERVHRTIRNALRKTGKGSKFALKNIV